MPSLKNDAILHYHEGRLGELGYAVPNFGNDVATLNPRLYALAGLVGRGLFHMLHRRDIDLNTAPRIAFLKDMHDLYVNLTVRVDSWTVPDNVEEHEPVHATPSQMIWKVWPVPFFRMRNEWIKDWAGIFLQLISEIFQHTENAKDADISPRVATIVKRYASRAYHDMAGRCFLKTKDALAAQGGYLTQEDFDAANFSHVPDWERMDTVPDLGAAVTEDMIAPFRDGLYVTLLPADLQPYTGLVNPQLDAAAADTRAQQIAGGFNPEQPRQVATPPAGSSSGVVSAGRPVATPPGATL